MEAEERGNVRGGAVLITGGSGFIGSHVARLLADRGEQVVLYDIVAPQGYAAWLLSPVRDRVRLVRGSVEDWTGLLAALRIHAVDRIVHIAAIQDPLYANDHPLMTYRVNLAGLINVLESARLVALRRVVHVSSVAALASKQREPVDEDHPVMLSSEGNPAGHYGASKAAGEIIALTYWAQSGVDAVLLRLASVYGPGMTQDLYIRSMVEGAVRGQSVRFATGGAMRRDYIYVKDVARAIHLALAADGSRLGRRLFLIASGATHTAAEVADRVRQVLPSADIEIGMGLSEWEARAVRTRALLDNRHAREELGYAPEYDLRDGIIDYLQELRAADPANAGAH